MTTASRALYDLTVNPPRLVGVVGVDLLMADIIKVEADYNLQLEVLKSRSFSCPTLAATACELKVLRETNYNDPSSPNTNTLCGSEPVNCPEQVVRCVDGQNRMPTVSEAALCSSVRANYEEEV
jgi:hypothetical protein